jgi:hypothetical protein
MKSLTEQTILDPRADVVRLSAYNLLCVRSAGAGHQAHTNALLKRIVLCQFYPIYR